MKKLFIKDWILYEELGNEGGQKPDGLKEVIIKYDDPNKNKHVPFIIENNDGYTVKIGKNEYHAEDDEHHTVMAQLSVDDITITKYFKNNEVPEFSVVISKGKNVRARAFCNLHGLFAYELKK